MTKGRSIRLFLADGTPGGIVTAEIMNWTGHVMTAPRSRLADLIQRPEAGRTGIYILSGTDPDGGYKPLVYVGETDSVIKRLAQHNKDDAKGFWEQTCVVTSKDQNLTKAHARYLESRLIQIAKESGRVTLVNNTSPDVPMLPEADLSDMEFFIEQLRVVLPVLGLEVLKEAASSLLAQERQRADSPATGNAPVDLGLDLGEVLNTALTSQFPRLRPSLSGTASPEFELRDNKLGLTARAIEIDGEMVVLKGSQARKDEGDSLTGTLRQRRRELLNAGILTEAPGNPRLYVFTADTPLKSPSQSSTLILGRSDNGRLSWHVRDSRKTYADWQEEQVAAVTQVGGEE
ncbi:GIY-YIG nuclease family protein [Magnetospirillum gryphiswaldense]|uniref:GIY-YIG nuclease family protein n=1 Tax=Magnetospirillum gryphiswaldense TaxID=55518 RepID=UPI000D03BD19|nr:GIY-YIG nuclease family protein [Magnetospirillum gryphiswaldense]AVM76074.1 hypothetical protein MSR1_36130 [Magnetospirillum gryphiswaldense MSR-1]AVM79977.1 hypothetical protein MSR1L_36130 [Magnetospirillum gryphiswaldense]